MGSKQSLGCCQPGDLLDIEAHQFADQEKVAPTDKMHVFIDRHTGKVRMLIRRQTHQTKGEPFNPFKTESLMYQSPQPRLRTKRSETAVLAPILEVENCETGSPETANDKPLAFSDMAMKLN